MRILVTAGNTQAMIDRVRCLTNVFSGTTGARIALTAFERRHRVVLLTSAPTEEVLTYPTSVDAPRWMVRSYRTYEDLGSSMGALLEGFTPDALIHCAAVSDYLSAGVYAPAPGTRFEPATRTWRGDGRPPTLDDRASGKVKSDEPELWLRLSRAPKLVDRIRTEWSFRGTVVKFKLEVGIGQDELRDIAERSRLHSQADLMVANTLEGVHDWALVGPLNGGYERVRRGELSSRLLDAVESLHEKRSHG